MTREEKEDLLREAVDILIKLDNHLMTSRDNAEFSSWVEELIDNNRCEERAHWIDNHNGTISCSCCHAWFHKDDRYSYMRYCPNCGAEMESKE